MFVLFVLCHFVSAIFVISYFAFANRVLVLIVSVPGHCFLLTFTLFIADVRKSFASLTSGYEICVIVLEKAFSSNDW